MGNNSRPSQPNQRDDIYIRKIEALGLIVLFTSMDPSEWGVLNSGERMSLSLKGASL